MRVLTLNDLRRFAARSPLSGLLLQSPFRRAAARAIALRFVPAARHVDHPARFLYRELRRAGTASYRLRGSDVRIVVRHDTGGLELLYDIFSARCYDLPPAVCAGVAPRIVDLGANVGAFAAFSLMQAPGASLVCVEPDAANLQALGLFHDLNPWADVRIVAACAEVADGVAPFASGLGAGCRVQEDGSETATVDALRLLAWADFAKIDIEGSEWPLLADQRLAGVGGLALAMEYHRRYPFDTGAAAEAERLLRSAGFSVVRREANYWGHGLLWAHTGAGA